MGVGEVDGARVVGVVGDLEGRAVRGIFVGRNVGSIDGVVDGVLEGLIEGELDDGELEGTLVVGVVEETYSTSNQTSSNDLLNKYCTKKRWMVACRSSETPDIMVVAAQAPRVDVTRQTVYNRVDAGAPPPIIPTVSNGVSWYWSTNNSFGFAPAGESIVLDECDVNDAPDRICIHFTNNYVSQGYRCGVEKREAIENWYRVILHTDEDTNDF